MQQYAIAVAQGNTAGMKRLQEELEKLSAWGPRSITLYYEQYYFREYHALCRSKMMSAIADMATDVPVKFVLENAIPADKKAYPKKSLIVIFSTLASFILSIFVLLTIEKIESSKREGVEA